MTLELLRQIVAGEVPGAAVGDLIGMRMVAAEEGRVTFELDAGPQHTSPPGTLHGGILCDLADGAMGCACVSLLAEGDTFTTVELKINFLKPVWIGPADRGRRGDQGGADDHPLRLPRHRRGRLLVAYATSTCMTQRGEAAPGG